MKVFTPPSPIRAAVRSMYIAAVIALGISLIWGPLSGTVLQSLASNLGPTNELYLLCFWLTHVLVAVGTPLGCSLIAAALTTSVLANLLWSSERVLLKGRAE